MPGGGARRGRRDNGIDASEFAVVGDVDPRVGEHLLDVLAAGGIAAYLQPSADLNPVTRTTTVPPRPTDRLYVDRTHLATARNYLTQLADDGGPPEAERSEPDPDVDAAWSKIIEGYHLEVETAARPWPAVEDVVADPTAPPPVGPGTNPEPRPARSPGVRPLTSATDISGISLDDRDDRSLLDGLDTFGADLPDDPEDGYTPPPPPPLPRLSRYTVLGVLAVLLGFVLFLFPELLPIDRDVAQVTGFAGILTGFVTLIWRLRPGDDDADPDDGAVV
ncbi:hypothetical protein [Plantactinospora sp. KBS50]|uniref:hypothetical protein n=1 Tax=Plantactinospora sp. KBS50 TaxID=2024580 RepID=UPI000BAAC04B|nr:hypothetical protein [Plantactinospora sp. KBS50]ASW56068.1 hypothetical protein CIK06_20650 [Plantactinospora sp. KBS50]